MSLSASHSGERFHMALSETSRLIRRIRSSRPGRAVVSPLHARIRVVALCIVGLLLLQWSRGGVLASGYEPFATALARHGLVPSETEQSRLMLQRQGSRAQALVFRAQDGEAEPGDLWIAKAAIARDGRVASLTGLHNLTRTSSAEESSPVVAAGAALFARSVDGEVVALELLDLHGEAPSDQGVRARLQRGITNLQQTGRWSGIGHRSYVLRSPAREVTITAVEDRFLILLDGVQRAEISSAAALPREGRELFEVRTHATVVVELLPWLVDTVRALPFVGAEPIAWLENKAFAFRDRIKQAYYGVNGTDHEAEVAEELGVTQEQPREEEKRVERLAVPNPDSGWPPVALDPVTSPSIAGEGKWRAIVDDPHARALPDGSPVFYQTFLRPDAERSWARMYLTVWDPRLVQLNMVSGTEEPMSATGETGTGLIPRDPDTLRRLVGAFNGGFQAVHGEFGMMASGRVYLPPKPWAATVAVFSDGRVAMGSWPGPEDKRKGYDEASAVEQIPAGMIGYRQNLTSLVEEGVYNPWQRWWWGAAPNQQGEQTLTQRSALCMTRTGFMLYAWGDSLSPQAMGQALIAAGCVRALHLDMNSSHCGMEFYNVFRDDEAQLPKGPRERYRFEGTVAGLPGYTVRSRRAVTSMGTELARYIKPDPRDYFYLTLKGGIETASSPAGTKYASTDLPHAGWPPALARADAPQVRLIRLDPARAMPTTGLPNGGEIVLAELRGDVSVAELDDQALFAVPQAIGFRYEVGIAPADAVVVVHGPLLSRVPEAMSALGVDAEGLLVYGEADQAGVLADAMTKASVSNAIAFRTDVKLGLHFREGVLAVDGATRLRDGQEYVRFVASSKAAVEVLFPETKPMPYSRWAYLQDQRVRYFRTAEPTAKLKNP